MPVVVVAICLVALIWGAIFWRRITPLGITVAIVALGYVFGYSFWHLRAGPIPLTIDRALLVALVALLGTWLWQGRSEWRGLALTDWAIGATLVWLTLSALAANLGGDANLPTSPFWRLAFSFWIPALLYFAIRCSQVTSDKTTWVLAVLSLLGTYLGLTALAEASEQWWAVFPHYIRDPELGTHFGRARGPALNSISLGVYLSVCFWSAWTLRSRVPRGVQLLLLAAMAIMAMGVLLTFTRSVWLGAGLSGLVMLIAETPRGYRWGVAAGSLVVGGLVAAAGWTYIVHLNREDSGEVSRHSVQQRAAFAHVSWNMFRDAPLFGVGFGRFYDKKLPYLSDRSQPFELESLRPLHHHNTILSLLVETGLVGVAAYLAVLIGWFRSGWRMAFGEPLTPATEQMGRLLLALLAIYLPSALFHDMSLIFQDQWLLFLVAGLAIATAQQAPRPALATVSTAPPVLHPTRSTGSLA